MKNFFKTLLEIISILFLIVLLAVITFGVWIYFRGTQSLEIADARGITFWQFIKERWDAWADVNARISALPQYAGCRNDILHYTPLNFKGAFNFAYASANPDSRLAKAFLYWEKEKPDPVLPTLKAVSWHQVPDVFWDYLTRAYWRGLVTIDYMAGQCQLGPVDFDAIFSGGVN